LQNILKENQKFWLAHWGLGLAYEQKGMMSNSITEFETAAVLSGRSANAIASCVMPMQLQEGGMRRIRFLPNWRTVRSKPTSRVTKEL
jgi:hypothetical protein